MTKPDLWGETRPADHSPEPMLRASDRDRDIVAERLRTQHAEGRLDIDELQERIDRCYDAKTLGELEQLLLDLPRESSAQERPEWLLGRWRSRLWSLAPVWVALAAISAVTGRHLIWLAIPLFFAARFAYRSHQRPPRYDRDHHSLAKGTS